jgi:putative N6-adenine-specific DNA methylase
MNQLRLFLPCAAGVEDFLAQEVHHLTGLAGDDLMSSRGGVFVRASWRDALKLNLHSRLAQRVLVELAHGEYRSENDLYAIAGGVAWEIWFTPRQTFKIETTAQHSPLTSLNFATLRIKDAIADRFRAKAGGVRPSIETQWPDCRVFAHLTTDTCTLYIDTSGEPLFKRGWRQDKGDAPLKETLAAAMLAASGWWNPETGEVSPAPLYDPCCGSGTIAIEAAQIALGMPAGGQRRFGFEKLLPFQAHVWAALKDEAERSAATAAASAATAPPAIFGSDVSHRMVDFAQRNAERAGVAASIDFRGGDALQRMPPAEGGVIMLNPPYGERIEVGGVAARGARGGPARMQRDDGFDGEAPAPRAAGREQAQTEDGGEFFAQLASHWKKHYAGWTAWMLTPDLQCPKRMRLKESRRVPMWNGPIECRLFRFDMVAGSARTPRGPD